MTVPKLSEFTFEHARCVVPAGAVRDTALVMLSGMFPRDGGTGAAPHTRALGWFGKYMFPAPMPSHAVLPLFQTRARRAKDCVDELANCRDDAVLDLVLTSHTAALMTGTQHVPGAMCGFATLSLAGTGEPATLGAEGLSYGARQLRLPYVPIDAAHQGQTLRNINYAIEATRTDVAHSARTTAVPTDVLADGRPGTAGTFPMTTANEFAAFAADDHGVWALIPRPHGEDIDYDTRVCELAGSTYFRVFEARTNQED